MAIVVGMNMYKTPVKARNTPDDETRTRKSNIPTAIKVTNIKKTFGRLHAVHPLSLSIPHGQIVALLGQNGAGKTTLIDMILGLSQPTHGQAYLYGMTPRDAIRRSLIGSIHQTGGLPEDHTVSQVIRLIASTHRHPQPLHTILETTHLLPLMKRRISKLSGGEKQRVRLALALLPNPKLLILDEPTAGMDANARREFWRLMRQHADDGQTIVFATHYLAEAQEFAERTIIMSHGHIVRDGATEIIRQEAHQKTLTISLPSHARAEVDTLLTDQYTNPTTHWHWRSQRTHDNTAPLTGIRETVEHLTLTAQTAHIDCAALALLNIPGARDIEVTAPSLEDVFTSIVQEDAQ